MQGAEDEQRVRDAGAKGERGAPASEAATDPSHPSHTPEVGPRDEHVGKTFGGKYRIERLIAKGGMGRVYRATQFPLERPVAIKILNKEFKKADPQFARRFTLEAATAAKLSHPHTITVFDYGETEGGDLYIAMEYLRGRPLSKVISEDGPMAPERALRIAIQVCRAVREAHGLGIIHRDLKPGNIFLVEEGDEGDYAKVLDFGLVKLFRPEGEDAKDEPGILAEGDFELTRTGTLLGSPKYMSPEQIQGHHLDPRTDIYSFGVILFQMIAGKPPYTGATGVDVIYKHVHTETPSIADIAPEVSCPAVVEAVIRKCLEKRRDDRFPSMDDLVSHLKEALRILGTAPLPSDSLGGDSSASLRPLPVRSRAPEKSGPIPVKGVREEARSRATSRSEARLAEQVVEDPTPSSQSVDRARAREDAASRVPLLIAFGGFVIALATLLWVVVLAPRFRQDASADRSEPARQEPAKQAEPTKLPEPAKTAATSTTEAAHHDEAAAEVKVEEPKDAVQAKDAAGASDPSSTSAAKKRRATATTKSKKDRDGAPTYYRQNPY